MTASEARQKLGLSIAEMVRLMDVPRSSWNSWERGEREPDSAARRLMAVLVWLHDVEPAAYERLRKI